MIYILLLLLVLVFGLGICHTVRYVFGWKAFEEKFGIQKARHALSSGIVLAYEDGEAIIFYWSCRRGSWILFDTQALAFFHKPLYIAWADIYDFTARQHRYDSVCHINTQPGQIRIYGAMSTIIINALNKAQVTQQSFL